MTALRVYRSSIRTGAAAPVRLRVIRSSITVKPSSPVRLRVYRSSIAILPTVQAPATVTADSFQLVSVTATAPSAVTAWSWRQASGPTQLVLQSASTAIVSFTAPASLRPADYVLEVRALTAAGWTAWRQVKVTVARHPLWAATSQGVVYALGTPQDRDQLAAKPPGDTGTTDPGPVVPPVTGSATPGLWYKRPVLQGLARKSFPHYFPPYPLSFNNEAADAGPYPGTYLKTTGIVDYADEGGLLRNRPFPEGPNSVGVANPFLTAREFEVQNARKEIGWAIDGGHDGFMPDLLGLTGQNWNRILALINATERYYPGQFYVVPVIDANGGHGNPLVNGVRVLTDPLRTAENIRVFRNRKSSFYLPDGRFVVASFKAEGLPLDWTKTVLANVGGPSAYMGVFLDYAGKSPGYAEVLNGAIAGMWGYGGDPVPISRAGSQANLAHSRGQKWIEGLNGQNIRMNQHWWEEAAGTEAYKQSHLLLIRGGAEFSQPITWSDFSEGGETMPSVEAGFVLQDLSCFWLAEWKTGKKLPVLDDCLVVSHRGQFVTPACGYVYPSTSPMTQRRDRNGVTEPLNIVEVRGFFRQAGNDVTISWSGAGPAPVTIPNVGAGEQRLTAPLGLGVCTVTAKRAGVTVASITTNLPVLDKPVVQNLNYRHWSSLRPLNTYLTPLSHV